jgi:tetratricopeptide (TPR) repeat protein
MRNVRLQIAVAMVLLLAGRARGDSSGVLKRGLEEARNGNCPAAEIDLKKAVSENPNEPLALTALAVCESESGHPEQATASFEQVTKLQPAAWQAWNNLGANYLALNRQEAAAQAFRKAISVEPNSVSAWFNLGSCLLQSGNKLEAFRALDHAQQIDPRDPELNKAWMSIADTLATEAADLIDKAQYTSAFTLLSATHRALQSSASWNNLIGYAEFKLKQPEDAKHHLEAALQMDPDNEGYLLDVGDFLAAYQAFDEATRFFEVGAKRMPNSAPVKFGLAISYMLQNRTDQAIALLEQLHAQYPGWGPVNTALGEGYEAGAHWAAMVQLGTGLRSAQPQNPLGWYLYGAGRERLDITAGVQLNSAIEALQQAVRLDPSSSRYRLKLGKTLGEGKQYQNAIAELKEAIRLDPGNSEAHYSLARAYKQVGEAKLASEEFKVVSGIKAKSARDVYVALLNNTQRTHP